MALTEITSKSIKDGEIINADINASADIAGSKIADNAITLAKMAGGTDGQIITYDASGDPVAVGPGNDGQVLTATGAGSPPAFETLPTSGATINNATENEIVTVASTTSQLDAEANLTFDGSTTFTQTSSSDLHMKLISGTAGYSRICLGDTDDDNIGELLYNNANNKLSVKTNATVNLEVESDGDVVVNNGDLIIGTDDKGIKGDSIHIKADDDQIIAKLHKTNSSEFYFNNSKKLEVTNGGISVTGNVTPSSGIYLGGSGGSNHLSDYEEGTWTPNLTGLTNTPTWSNRTGRYIKIGKLCHVHGFMQGSSTTPPTFSNSAAACELEGLPFTRADDVGYRMSIGNVWSQIWHAYSNNDANINMDGAGNLVVSISGSTHLKFDIICDGYPGRVKNSAWTDGDCIVEFTLHYRTA